MKKIINCQNKLLFLSFHDNINLPCISEAAAGLIRLHVTVHQKDRNQDQCGRPHRQKAQSLHSFNALWSIIINPIRKLSNLLETLGNTKAQNYIFWEDNKLWKHLPIFLTLYLLMDSYVVILWTAWGGILGTQITPPQRPRIDLNKRFLPRPNTTTAWKLIPHRSNISKN